RTRSWRNIDRSASELSSASRAAQSIASPSATEAARSTSPRLSFIRRRSRLGRLSIVAYPLGRGSGEHVQMSVQQVFRRRRALGPLVVTALVMSAAAGLVSPHVLWAAHSAAPAPAVDRPLPDITRLQRAV